MPEDGKTHATLKTVSVVFFMLFLWLSVWCVGLPLPPALPSVLLLMGLGGLTWFDFDHFRIPNWISYPLILVGLGLAYSKGMSTFGWHVLGALIGYGFIWGLNVYWNRRHGKDGIGMGDAKLLGAAGSWLGPLSLPFVTLVASGAALLGIVLAQSLGRTPVSKNIRIPFGPYIAIGFWCVWLWSPI